MIIVFVAIALLVGLTVGFVGTILFVRAYQQRRADNQLTETEFHEHNPTYDVPAWTQSWPEIEARFHEADRAAWEAAAAGDPDAQRYIRHLTEEES